MTAAPKVRSILKSLYGFSQPCRPRNRCGKAAAQWEETGTGTTERAGVRVQASKKRFASDNVGKGSKDQQRMVQAARTAQRAKSDSWGEVLGLAHEVVRATKGVNPLWSKGPLGTLCNELWAGAGRHAGSDL